MIIPHLPGPEASFASSAVLELNTDVSAAIFHLAKWELKNRHRYKPLQSKGVQAECLKRYGRETTGYLLMACERSVNTSPRGWHGDWRDGRMACEKRDGRDKLY